MSATVVEGSTWPPHTPGAGLARLRAEWGEDRVPESTPESRALLADLLSRAAQLMNSDHAA